MSKIDDVTPEIIDSVSETVRQRRYEREQRVSTSDHPDPYPCDEHRHWRCTECGAWHCGREFDVDPWKSESEHERLCHTCNEEMRIFEPYNPLWVRNDEAHQEWLEG